MHELSGSQLPGATWSESSDVTDSSTYMRRAPITTYETIWTCVVLRGIVSHMGTKARLYVASCELAHRRGHPYPGTSQDEAVQWLTQTVCVCRLIFALY